MTEALALIDAGVADAARARFYQQAAYVHHLLPDRGNAWNYANLAIDLARTCGLFDVVARAYSALYTIVYDDEGLPISLPEGMLPVELREITAFRPAASWAEKRR